MPYVVWVRRVDKPKFWTPLLQHKFETPWDGIQFALERWPPYQDDGETVINETCVLPYGTRPVHRTDRP